MSGSSKVEATSRYFHLSSESPCMNFATRPEDPGQEGRWHREWKEHGAAWLERAKPILEERFASLAAQWPIVAYDGRLPLWTEHRTPEAPPPWRVGFVGMSGPGMTQVTVAFSALPDEPARERFRQELIDDFTRMERI